VTQDALLEAIDRLNEPVKTILVVDDELDAQKLFLRMLTSANRGYQVLRASHGLQALNLVRREKVSLILLDLIMPEMDGYEFLKVKAADPNLCDIPVILVSAQDLRGAPVVSNYLAVTRGGGLSVRQILDFIQSFVAIMASSNPHTGSANPGAVRD
jgi:CheY-like chemotaxis protein